MFAYAPQRSFQTCGKGKEVKISSVAQYSHQGFDALSTKELCICDCITLQSRASLEQSETTRTLTKILPAVTMS